MRRTNPTCFPSAALLCEIPGGTQSELQLLPRNLSSAPHAPSRSGCESQRGPHSHCSSTDLGRSSLQGNTNTAPALAWLTMRRSWGTHVSLCKSCAELCLRATPEPPGATLGHARSYACKVLEPTQPALPSCCILGRVSAINKQVC